MDTESFLLERRTVIARLCDRRRSSLESRGDRPSGITGRWWWGLGKSLLGFGVQAKGFEWLAKAAFAGLAPVAVGLLERRALRRISIFEKLARLASFFKV